jgi:hypothetical protein
LKHSQTGLLAAVSALAVLTAVACGSSSPGGTSASSPASSHSASAKPSGSSSPTFSTTGRLTGIIVMTIDSSGVRLEAIDPTNGHKKYRQFNGATLNTATGSVPGSVYRQEFSSNFTEAIAQGPTAADGSASAGMVNSSGQYTPLTASTSGGSGSPVVKQPLAFNPATGRLWYDYSGGPAGGTGYVLGSVDPGIGPSSDRQESPVTPADPTQYAAYYAMTGMSDAAYFAPDGFGPANAGGNGGFQLFLPNGQEVVTASNGTAVGFQVGKEGQMTASTPDLLVAPSQYGTSTNPELNVGHPIAAVTATSFIANNQQGNNQLFYCVIGSSYVRCDPLLGASNRTITDVVACPDGTQIAYISEAGSSLALFALSLKTGAKPVKLADLPPTNPSMSKLLAWVN